MKPIPFLGGGLQGKSRTVTAQRKLNLYLEHRPDGDKGVKVVVFGTPGLRKLFATPNNVIPRGIMGTSAVLYVCCANLIHQLTPAGILISTNTIGTAAGAVEMAYSPSQVLLVDGTSGYLIIGSTMSVIGAAFPNGARTITFVAGYFIAEQPNTQQFWVSNLFDGSTWNALSFASASQFSDTLVAVDNLSGLLVLFSNLHMEFWQNVGSSPQPFAPILSATNEWGLVSTQSRCHASESIVFLGLTRTGQVQVCQVSGYTVKVISTPDLDSVINGFSAVSDAVGLSYQVDEHVFYQITFPSADRSFLYDFSTTIWSETQTGHTTKYATRHIGNLSTLVGLQRVISDWSNGNIYVFDTTSFTDNGVTIERELITRHAIDGHNEFTIDEIYMDVEVGVGLISGQGSNPQLMLQISRDDGKTYETEQWVPLGVMGAYTTRVLWRRQGSARTFTIKNRYTEPTKFVIADAAVSIRKAPQ